MKKIFTHLIILCVSIQGIISQIPNESFLSNNSAYEQITNIEQQVSGGIKRIYMHFTTVTELLPTREILLGFTSFTTDAYDYGYEALLMGLFDNDFGSILDGNIMGIQAYSDITNEKSVLLYYKSCGNYSHQIKIDRIENIDPNLIIYLKDNLTNTYFDLNKLTSYEFTSIEGAFYNRFEIIFIEFGNTLELENQENNPSLLYFQNSNHKLFSKNLNADTCKITIINMEGQNVLTLNNVSKEELSAGLLIPILPNDIYIVKAVTSTNKIINIKILII